MRNNGRIAYIPYNIYHNVKMKILKKMYKCGFCSDAILNGQDCSICALGKLTHHLIK